MALFGSKKNKDVEKAPKAEAKKAAPKTAKPKVVKAERISATPAGAHMAGVLVRPRITEKAANMTASNVYTFDITASATKGQVMAAIKAIYKVNPVKVNVVNTPAKKVKMRRKRGFGATAAGRKAYVFLKKGEEIQVA